MYVLYVYFSVMSYLSYSDVFVTDMCVGIRMNRLLFVLKSVRCIESSSQLHHIIILITSSVVHYALVSNLYSHDPIMI